MYAEEHLKAETSLFYNTFHIAFPISDTSY